MRDVVAACTKWYQVAYRVYSVLRSDSGQRCHVVNMDKVGADCAVLVFVAHSARLAARAVVFDAETASSGIAFMHCQLYR